MAATAQDLFLKMVDDAANGNERPFIESMLVVEDKLRRRVPFIYNDIQADANDTETGMDIWVKPSSVGFSTERIAKRLVNTLLRPGTNTVLVAYEDFITSRLLSKVSFFYNHLASLGIPGFPEIHHDSDFQKTFHFKDAKSGQVISTSSIYIASARSKTAGRAEVIHHLLLDEHAFYVPEATERIIAPAMARIPPGGTVDSFCYDDKTEILTNRGWVLFSDLTINDLVLTKGNDDMAYYIKPSDYQSFEFHGDMIHFTGKHLDLLVTPNHNVLVRRRFNEFCMEKAEDAMTCSGLNFDYKFGWNGEYVKDITIPPYTYRFGNTDHMLPGITIPIDLWMEFIGYFLSEGTLGHNIHNNSDKVSICQSVHSGCYEDIKRICILIADCLGKHLSEYTNDVDVTYFTICDVRLAKILEEYAKPKRIPNWVLALPKEQLWILFCSYMQGDGFSHVKGTDMDRCFTASEPLSDGLQELGLKLGYYTHKYYREWKDDYRPEFSGKPRFGWDVSFNKDGARGGYPSCRLSRGGMKRERYDGIVYDVTIPTSNHLLMVRRNGKPIWSGNSTPNGEDNEFHQWYGEAKSGTSIFTAHFYPWFMHKEYQFGITDSRAKHVQDGDKPEFKLTVDEELLQARGVSFNQIRWRRYMSKVQESLRRSGQSGKLFQQEFPEDDVSCFLATGNMYFDVTAVENMAHQVEEPKQTLDNALIWRLPEKDRRYIVAIDPGQAKITQTAIIVLTYKQDEHGIYHPVVCARDSGLYLPDLTAKKAIRLSDMYSRAMIAWEANSHGMAITELLKNRRPIYYRKDIVSGITSTEPGWLTSSRTKDYMMDTVVKYLPDIECPDIELVRQMRNHKLQEGKLVITGPNDIFMAFALGLVCLDPKPTKRGKIGQYGWRW